MRPALLLLWVIWSLVLASRHEPWRDEAQAWLVARNAESFFHLIYRPAMEATGPLYYWLLWPATKVTGFVSGVFWVSWVGSLASVALLLHLLPLPLAILAMFGPYWGYEYAAISRLYGWGCAFLLAGVYFDRKEQRRPTLILFSLAIFTQLNLTFAVMAWCASREWKRYWPLVPVALLSVVHVKSAGPHPWTVPGLVGLVPWRIFSSLGLPFVQWPLPLESWGALALVAGLLSVGKREALGLVIGLVPFATLFATQYAGYASLRHAGPLFCVWLLLVKRQALAILLLLISLPTLFLKSRADWNDVYSDGLGAALAIQKLSDKPVLHAQSSLEGFVAAAVLDRPFAIDGHWVGEPFFRNNPENADCVPKQLDCFFLGNRPPATGRWERLSPAHTTLIPDESFSAFRRIE